MVVVRASGYLFDHQIQYPVWEPPAETLRHWVQNLGVGGVLLLGGSAAEIGLRSHQLQDWATIPLLLAADIEEGVGQRFAGATWFPPPMALGAIAQRDLPTAMHLAEQMGEVTAREAVAMGLNWLLAPVVDVNNNPNNPVINVRAFGETAEVVSQLTTAFIRGAQQHPVLTAAKHFPGHGDTATDSHLELPVLSHSLERLAMVELPPFQAAIAAGVDAVMTAHLHIPAMDATDPATLSHQILTGELRQHLGFDGLIVTDALVMGAIAKHYGVNEVPVRAVEAGADILLMPADPEGAIAAVCHAVETGRISVERIHASIERIWRAKQKVGVLNLAGDTSHQWENVTPSPVQLDHIAQADAIATVEAILYHSLRSHLPFSPSPLSPSPLPSPSPHSPLSSSPLNLILLDDLLHSNFLARQTPAIAIPQEKGYQLQIIDSHTPPIPLSLDPSEQHSILLQVFIRGNPFRGSARLTQRVQDWFHHLVRSQQLQAMVIYGSPYSLEHFLPQLSPEIPYIFTYGQMPSAQAIALKTLFSLSEKSSLPLQSPDYRFTT